MAAIDKVKVVVVGDSGVGKTSLVHLICHNEPQSNPGATIGCSVEVKLHEFRAGLPNEKTYFVELWDIGGSASHQSSRSIFYNSVSGIILVHDLTNRKSHQNMRKWLAEVLNKGASNKDISQKGNGYDFDPEQFAGNQTPILVVGTKADLAQSLREETRSYEKYSSVAEECGADEFHLDCMQVKYLAPGSTNAVKLTKFFDKAIERRSGNQACYYCSTQINFQTGLNWSRLEIDLLWHSDTDLSLAARNTYDHLSAKGHISPIQDRRRVWKSAHVD